MQIQSEQTSTAFSNFLKGAFFVSLAMFVFMKVFSGPSPAIPPPAAPVVSQGENLSSFDHMKSLVGRWEGASIWQGHPEKNVSEYRLISHGSAVEERSFVGMPHEMISIYYPKKNGKLGLTHFCILGNHPILEEKSFEKNRLVFECVDNCGFDPPQHHLQLLSFTFPDKDHMTHSHVAFKNGKPATKTFVMLTRKRF